jgi:hypothetical protein
LRNRSFIIAFPLRSLLAVAFHTVLIIRELLLASRKVSIMPGLNRYAAAAIMLSVASKSRCPLKQRHHLLAAFLVGYLAVHLTVKYCVTGQVSWVMTIPVLTITGIAKMQKRMLPQAVNGLI